MLIAETRRFFPRIVLSCIACLMITLHVSAEELRVYIGTYTRGGESQGIYTAVLDTQSGSLTAVHPAADADNPSFLAIHPNGKLVFAVGEVTDADDSGSGTVVAYHINEDDGTLMPINSRLSHGGAPCHLVVDASGKFVLVANYMGGNVAVLPIGDDGALAPASSVMQHIGSSVNERRQEGPHAHSINLNALNEIAYACDLGTDRVQFYRFDRNRGLLAPAAVDSVKTKPGGGPRHFALHPNGRLAFANLELTSELTSFQVAANTGALTVIETQSTLPDGKPVEGNSTAECRVHPNGRFVYVSNRGHNSIAVFSVNADTGKLKQIQVENSGGKVPRNFYIEPSGKWLLAANQSTDNVVVFRINADTGRLTRTEHEIKVPQPVCVRTIPITRP